MRIIYLALATRLSKYQYWLLENNMANHYFTL